MKIDIHKVAQKAQVSISTVSRALNDSGSVSKETKDKVLAAAQELGYRHNSIASSLRSKRSLACMVVDLDAFKPINDRYGHDIGDIVLKQAAQALKRGLRTPDVVARMGGDEFLVICPDTSLAAAMACAERVRRSVESMVIPTGDLRVASTVSIGVAVRDEGMENADALVKCADQGLYLAKEKGRNCIAAYQQSR